MQAIAGLKRTLYPYQKEGVERFLSQGRLLLADDMGLGKTAQAISSTDILWRSEEDSSKGLIIAPASLKAAVGSRVGQLLRPADRGRRRLAART